MTQNRVSLEGEFLSCFLCHEVMKDPTTLDCGHNFCMRCVLEYWDTEDESPSCPKCRKIFRPRPALIKNLQLANVLAQQVKTERPEPKTRAELLAYKKEIKLDPKTAHGCQLLSLGNRKVTRVVALADCSRQCVTEVLSSQCLTGRCYWEVEWTGRVDVAVVSKGYSGDGTLHKHTESWEVFCSGGCFYFHNGVATPILAGQPSRVGVYLDHDAGVLSFFSVGIDTVTLLYRVCATFTRPLRAGVKIHNVGGTAGLY